ncbi:N-glycosylase/DNA lyase isoform X2 [Betta splendens]|uniref:N-glycosylase/DNA lyase n=1 Tax=Betta splendens TaxID=158456 RepID=A0A6P7MWE0_BETSP|nr:N-glycosylase/DNA lyase isoform X2 [Betta splendens]
MTKHALLSSEAKLWRSLACAKSELRLDLTLACGQSFRWRETAEGHWTGVMGGRVWTLTQTDDALWYYVYKKQDGLEGSERKRKASISPVEENKSKKRLKAVKDEGEPADATVQDCDVEEKLLRGYFQLDVKLGDLYSDWGAADPHFKRIADIFTGVRMLRQEPTECLFSFICTSNNHISRIQGMVERLCEALGSPLCQLDQASYYDFPSLSSLADRTQEGVSWDTMSCSCRRVLKVADCVCLMSLDKAEAVPIDTHVWQIAKRDYQYSAGSGQKSITDKLHRDLGDFFRALWGPYAGWAQSVLFCADLKKFQKFKQSPVKQLKNEEENEDKQPEMFIKSEKMS